MNKLLERENKRKSVVSALLSPDTVSASPDLQAAIPKKKSKGSRTANRVQRSYYYDKDIDKILHVLKIEQECTLDDVVNNVLRSGLQAMQRL